MICSVKIPDTNTIFGCAQPQEYRSRVHNSEASENKLRDFCKQAAFIEEVNEIHQWLYPRPENFKKLWVDPAKNFKKGGDVRPIQRSSFDTDCIAKVNRGNEANLKDFQKRMEELRLALEPYRKRFIYGTWDVQMISHILPLNQFFNIKSIKSMKNFESLTIGGKIHTVNKKGEYSQPEAPVTHKIKMIREDENTGDINIECATEGPMSKQSKFVIRREVRKVSVQEDTGIILSILPSPCASYHRGHVAKYLEYLKGLVIDAQNTLSHETKVWKESKK